MSTTWQDVSIYNPGEEGLIDPKCWELRIAGARLQITRSRDYPSRWVARCDLSVAFGQRPMSALDVPGAQAEALALLETVLGERLAKVRQVRAQQLDEAHAESIARMAQAQSEAA